MFKLFAMAALFAVISNGSGADDAQRATFEVVSVKISDPKSTPQSDDCTAVRTDDPLRFMARKVSLRKLIQCAYGLDEYQLSGGAPWLQSERYDIDARPAAASTHDQKLLMLRALLTDRFHLSFHTKTEPIALTVLSLSKSGPKIGPQFHPFVEGEAEPNWPREKMPRTFGPVTMKTWTVVLSGNMRPIRLAPMVDQTGLSGLYKITMMTIDLQDFDDWSNALDRQLGLRLDERKVPTEIFVIDGAERPTAN